MNTVGPNSASSGRLRRARDSFSAEGKRVHRAAVVIATNAFAGTFSATRARFRATLPSARLRLKLAVAYFTDSGVQPTWGGSDPVLESLTPFALDERGREALLDPTISGGTETLPFSFEWDSAADGFYGVVLFSAASANDISTKPGEYKVIATWEPTSEMSPEEWESIQQECQLEALQKPFAIGGGP